MQNVTLQLVDASTRPVIERLAQLDRHEASQYTEALPGPDGLYDFPRLSDFFTEPEHHAYLVHAGEQLAGFCLLRPFEGGSTFLHAFFIVRALRRKGVGMRVTTDLLRSRRGRWAIAFREENPAAARFWRQVATEVVGDNWTEESRRGVFTFLHLDVDQHGA